LVADRADDRREVDGVGRIVSVDDLQPGALHLRARAFESEAGILGIGAHEGDRLRLGIEAHRRVEVALRPADRRIRARRHDLEVSVVVELRIHIQPKQAHEGHVPLHHDRHRRRDHVGAVAGHHHVHLVDVEELRVDARHRRGVGLVVVVDELDLAAEDAAPGVHVLLPDLHGDQRRLAVAR
jgi:hypothetical protein